jgi:DNA processing protein
MAETERDRAIAYALLPFLNPNRLRLLLEHFGSFDAVGRCSSSTIAMLLNIPAPQADLVNHPLQDENIRKEVDRMRSCAITRSDVGFPELLRHIPDPPAALFFRGKIEDLSAPSIAVVGSRNATPYGRNVADMLGRSLAREGIVVVSGMARGIDAAAHRGALAGGGRTVAVLGTGIDVIYPRNHSRLARDIEGCGALVTELGPGRPPLPSHFPMRNRLISGLTLGTVIVEATGRSGSLITARMAAEQGREVFAVPGPIFHPTSEGPHRLIQYGAKLLHDLEDLFDELPSLLRRSPGLKEVARPIPPELQQTLLFFDSAEPLHPDSIRAHLDVDASVLAERLLLLEMAGALRAVPGGRYVRTGNEK